MMRSQANFMLVAKSFACGESDSLNNASQALRNVPGLAVPGFFPPDLVVQIKAMACELPAVYQVPVSRWSAGELARHVRHCGLVATISGSTVWRWLHEDAIRPWQYRCWIFPRDPQFPTKAGRILDLYQRQWNGQPLKDDEFVVSADEKTSIQARRRRHTTSPPGPGLPMKVEHEYKRCGAWAYLAALDVHRAKLFGRCERRNGIAPFERLVAQVMTQAPYNDARRVFWIVDNGTAHRGPRSVARLQERYSNLVLVHGPIHASWLNQIEIYFSILQRRALTPNDFQSLQELQERILGFQLYYEQIAKPFEWKFTRRDLNRLLKRINKTRTAPQKLAA